jgi:hypothetical protein
MKSAVIDFIDNEIFFDFFLPFLISVITPLVIVAAAH